MGVTSEVDKVKQRAEPSDLGSSTTVATEVKVAIVSSTIQETIPDTQEQTDDTAESHTVPTGQDISPSPVDVSGQQSTAPKSGELTSAESPAHLHPDSTTSPSVIPRADHAEAPTKPSSSEARPQDAPSSSTPRSVVNTPTVANTLSVPGSESSNVPTYARRLSFRSLAFFYGRDKAIPPSSTSSHTPISLMRRQSDSNTLPQPRLSRSEKEAYFSAITLRTLMIGSTFPPPPSETTTILKFIKLPNSKSNAAPPLPDIKKVKGHLLKPESANAIIFQLRRLPIPDGPSFHVYGHTSSDSLVTHPVAGGAPIHAVCLPCTDEEAEKTYFSRLRIGHNLSAPTQLSPDAKPTGSSPNIAVASLESLVSVLRDLHLVSLLESPDLGFGQPVSEGSSGPLTGSVPSAETVMEGFEEITEQLMKLGFATGSAVLPSHAGIYPPTDRMSVLTCERRNTSTYIYPFKLALERLVGTRTSPSRTLNPISFCKLSSLPFKTLLPSIFPQKVKSISNTLLNFLSALALFNNGVREALPFIRYVANFVDFEWSAIRAQDKGKGVVCAATWYAAKFPTLTML
jgi:hypothetical protein